MPEIRPFIDTLREIERGNLLDELSAAQHEVVTGVRDTGKAGKLTVTFKYKPDGRGQMSVESVVKQDVPSASRGQSLFFVTDQGNLQRNDPRQRSLDISPREDEQPQTAQ